MLAARASLVNCVSLALCAGVGAELGSARAQDGPFRVEAQRSGGRLVARVWGSPAGQVRVTAHHSEGEQALVRDDRGRYVGPAPPAWVAVVARVGEAVVATVVGGPGGPAVLLVPLEVPASVGSPSAVLMGVVDGRGQPSQHVPLQVQCTGGQLVDMRWQEPGVALLQVLAGADGHALHLMVSVAGNPAARVDLPVRARASPEVDAEGAGEGPVDSGPEVGASTAEPERGPEGYGFHPDNVAGVPAGAAMPRMVLGGGIHGGVDTWGWPSVGGTLRLERPLRPWARIGGTVRYAATFVEAGAVDPVVQGSLTGGRHTTDVMATAAFLWAPGPTALRVGGGLGASVVREGLSIGGDGVGGWGAQLVADVRAGPMWRFGRHMELLVDVGMRVRALESSALWSSAPVRFFVEVTGAWTR
jgi:hypothetical protein